MIYFCILQSGCWVQRLLKPAHHSRLHSPVISARWRPEQRTSVPPPLPPANRDFGGDDNRPHADTATMTSHSRSGKRLKARSSAWLCSLGERGVLQILKSLKSNIVPLNTLPFMGRQQFSAQSLLSLLAMYKSRLDLQSLQPLPVFWWLIIIATWRTLTQLNQCAASFKDQI